MNLDPMKVAAGYRLLLQRPLADMEAAKLAKLLGSRQELLAHLLLTKDAFSSWPRLKSKLTNTARHFNVIADTPRKSSGDLLGYKQASEAMEQSIKAVIDADMARREANDQAIFAHIDYEQATDGHKDAWRPKRKAT